MSATNRASLVMAEALVPLVLVAATMVLVCYEGRSTFANDDTIIYSVAASMWSNGAIPYRDIVDQKPPGIYAFYRLCFFFGGRFPRSFWQGFTWITGIAAIFIYWGFRLIGRCAAGIGTATAFVIFLWADPLGLTKYSQAETESLATVWGAVAFSLLLAYQRFLTARWAILAGAAFSAAVLSKQPAACWLLPLSVQVIAAHSHRRWSDMLRGSSIGLLGFGLGGGVVLGGCLAYFAFHHALWPFYDWVYLRNLNYANVAGGIQYHWWVLLDHCQRLANDLKRPESWPFVGALLLLFPALLWRRSWLDVLVVVWGISSLVAVGIGSVIADHYLVFTHFAFALAFGAAFDWLCGADETRGRVATILSCLALCMLIFSYNLGIVYRNFSTDLAAPVQRLQAAPSYRMAQKIRRYAQPGDRLLGWGSPLDVLFYADMMPPGKYIFWPTDTLRPDPDEFIREVRNAKPAFIYVAREAPFTVERGGVCELLRRFVDEQYELWFDEGVGRVYRLRDRQWPDDSTQPASG